jgi:hypothetical protein
MLHLDVGLVNFNPGEPYAHGFFFVLLGGVPTVIPCYVLPPFQGYVLINHDVSHFLRCGVD